MLVNLVECVINYETIILNNNQQTFKKGFLGMKILQKYSVVIFKSTQKESVLKV